MGRKPGSKNKPKVSPLVEENKENLNGFGELKEQGYFVTPNKEILAVDKSRFKPMPDNWFSMSRTEQMRWLQENRK